MKQIRSNESGSRHGHERSYNSGKVFWLNVFCTGLFCLLFFQILPVIGSTGEAQFQEDIARLTAGVGKIAKPGVPGPIACVSENSFPVILGKAGDSDQTVIAATRFGKGKVVAFGHNGFMEKPASEEADTPKLLANAAKWAARLPHKSNAKPVAGLIFALDMAKPLEKLGFEVKFLGCPGWKDRISEIDLLVGSNLLPDREHEIALTEFISNGGGFLTSGLAWGWMQLNPELDLRRDHPLNRVLAPMGLAFVDGYINEIGAEKIGDGQWLRRAHAIDALNCLEHSLESANKQTIVPGQTSMEDQALAVVTAAYRWLPENESSFRERVNLIGRAFPRPIIPTRKSPLGKAPLARLALIVDHLDAIRQKENSRRPADSAADYPGGLPDNAPGVTREPEIDISVAGWASTGLWAIAGETVEVTLPEACSEKGFFIRIGCHTDKNWHLAEWSRHPEIFRSFPAKAGLNKVFNPHGGLIYLEVPRRQEPMPPKPVNIRIAGGIVEAPFFVLDKTDKENWQRLRNAPAPWAELRCERIILTVPASEIRSLDDPEPLMQFWNRVLGYYEELGCRPLDRRPQRIVADRQISNGWLHAGYPIMANIDVAPKMVNLQGLANPEKDVEGAWGFWHELGHNHQKPEWTFNGATEVTCNLFSLFVEEKIRGIAPKNHPWLKGQIARVQNYLLKPDFEIWKKDPGLALCFFVELQNEFGWKAFQKFFASYTSSDNVPPATDDEKRDQWLIRMSRATGHNLSPHFTKWGIPVSETARRQASSLPLWQP